MRKIKNPNRPPWGLHGQFVLSGTTANRDGTPACARRPGDLGDVSGIQQLLTADCLSSAVIWWRTWASTKPPWSKWISPGFRREQPRLRSTKIPSLWEHHPPSPLSGSLQHRQTYLDLHLALRAQRATKLTIEKAKGKRWVTARFLVLTHTGEIVSCMLRREAPRGPLSKTHLPQQPRRMNTAALDLSGKEDLAVRKRTQAGGEKKERKQPMGSMSARRGLTFHTIPEKNFSLLNTNEATFITHFSLADAHQRRSHRWLAD